MVSSPLNLSSEAALFIDFESIRYSFLNYYGQEPDPQILIGKARQYGVVPVAYAYADFSRHSEMFERKLLAAGIERKDCPAKESPDGRQQSTVDLNMVMDIVDTALDRPQIDTFILMTGDRDFVRISAKLKHRFGKRVVISGVPGTVSRDLIESATIDDPIVLEPDQHQGLATIHQRLIRFLDWADLHWQDIMFGRLARYLASDRRPVGPITEEEARVILSAYVRDSLLRQEYVYSEDGRQRRILILNREHPTVAEVINNLHRERAARLAAESSLPDDLEAEDRSNGQDASSADEPQVLTDRLGRGTAEPG